ncbi:hypothetical protein AV530_008025 [Patagioenas fasciata monilis]|uniref:Uncharacterized protein n=1 Tax=Patagioenas fasciata monilis TaxID=372326 RepID=A0A1V4KU66_PATFA|nr:hypothetical protein AV530_008025 [Patagioenas fasciata monilis]
MPLEKRSELLPLETRLELPRRRPASTEPARASSGMEPQDRTVTEAFVSFEVLAELSPPSSQNERSHTARETGPSGLHCKHQIVPETHCWFR